MMNKKDAIAEQEIIIANAQSYIKELESQQSKRFKPNMNGRYYVVDLSGEVSQSVWNNDRLDSGPWDFFNCYETEELATKASVMMKRNNAIIMACLMVDPDFVPDYLSGNQEQWHFYYLNPKLGTDGTWCASSAYQVNRGPCVSTIEKWEEAAALLEEWGVK